MAVCFLRGEMGGWAEAQKEGELGGHGKGGEFGRAGRGRGEGGERGSTGAGRKEHGQHQGTPSQVPRPPPLG